MQQVLARHKKRYYGRRVDGLSENELAQVLLDFAEELEQRLFLSRRFPASEPRHELWRVKRPKGRHALADLENLAVTTQVYELSAEERVVRIVEWSARRSAQRRVGRSSTSLGISSASGMCRRSMGT